MNDIAVKEIETKSVEILSTAQAIKIASNENYIQATELLLAIKQARRAVDETFDPVIASAHKAHKEACAAKKKHEQPLADAEVTIKVEIGRWLDFQEQLRRREEIKLQELARAQQEEMALQEAAALENAGMHREAEEALNAPVTPIILPPIIPKVTGISSRETYFAEVTDIKALCKAVADGKVPILAVLPNMPFLNNQARNLKTMLSYPGVVVQSKKVIAGKL